jgi:hypothetical protein
MIGKEIHSKTMFLPLMISQFIIPIKAVVAIPIATLMETVKITQTNEMFPEMAREIPIALECLSAAFVRAEEAPAREPS